MARDTLPPPNVTRLLERVDAGESSAWALLVPLVDPDLRRIARARLACHGPRSALAVTEVVHETYVRLLQRAHSCWRGRRHFFAGVGLAMRDVVIDHIRRVGRRKRGGWWRRQTLAEVAAAPPDAAARLTLDDALGRLASIDPEQHRIVVLRYFGGLSIDEVAAAMRVSPSTVDRQWRFARAWLQREIGRDSVQ